MPWDIAGTTINNIQAYNLSNFSMPTSGMQIFLTARLTESYPGTGSTWFDISGNGRNFTWVSAPTYTVGSYFNTLNNRCTGPASNSVGITNTSGYTIFLVTKQITVQSGVSAFKFYNTLGYGAGTAGRGIFSHCTWGNEIIYFDQGGCCNSDTRVFTDPIPNTTTLWGVYGFRRLTNSSTRNIFVNGVNSATNTDAAADINLGSTAIDLASSDEYGGNASAWNAQLSAFLVYNRGLTDAEMLQTSQSLRNLNGLT